jgi:hypothetical protein
MLNKRHIGPIIFIAIITSTAFLTISYSTAPRDISWISEVENWIRRENWEPDRECIPLMLDAFFLYENGEEEFFYLYSHHEFVSYIISLENDIDRKVLDSISKQFLDEVLASNKVLQHSLRFSRDFPRGGKYVDAYFILEDNLGRGLDGTIILEHFSTDPAENYYDVWEIAEWFF